MADLQEILNETAPTEETTETTTEATETTEAVETTGETETTTESDGGTPTPGETEKPADSVPKAALMDERSKRQALQAEVDKLKAEPTEKPDFWADPDKAIAAIQESNSKQMQTMFLNMSELNAKGRYEDFQEKSDFFFETMAVDNPALGQQALAQADPYDFIYKAAEERQWLNEVGDLESFETKIRAEERQKVEAEIREKVEAELKAAGGIPPSLSTARATGGNTNPAYSPPTMRNILGEK